MPGIRKPQLLLRQHLRGEVQRDTGREELERHRISFRQQQRRQKHRDVSTSSRSVATNVVADIVVQ